MALIDLADELILEIIKYLLPKPPQLANKPFHTWTETICSHGLTHSTQARDYNALGQTCKRLYAVLRGNVNHAHVSDWKTETVSSVLTHSEAHSLSIENNREALRYYQNEYFRHPADFGNKGDCILPVPNTSIHTLYSTDCAAWPINLTWLLDQLQGLKTLYLDFDDDGTVAYYGDDQFRRGFMNAVASHATSVETLIITNRACLDGRSLDRYFHAHGGLGLKGFTTLRSLSISCLFLLGALGFTWHRKETYELLPRSLGELEVFWDQCQVCSFITSCNDDRVLVQRPDWLFSVLSHKNSHLPALERVRIISTEEWHPGKVVLEPWEGDFTPHINDWTEKDGDENWRPPTELIVAAEKAKVSLGIWLHPQRQFKAVLPGHSWFSNSWEDTWGKVEDGTENPSNREDDGREREEQHVLTAAEGMESSEPEEDNQENDQEDDTDEDQEVISSELN